MLKRLIILAGVSILAVICNHSAGWGFTAMFAWTDRYLPVAVPNFDQMGTLSYWVLISIRQITVFSVPAFLFVSGFFVAYAFRGSDSKKQWKIIKTRLVNILIPYLIWSMAIFFIGYIIGERNNILEYLLRLLRGGAINAYFYIPVILQFYLLSPVLFRLAKSRCLCYY